MYCTLDDLKKAVPEKTLIQLTADSALAVIDTAKTDKAIADASAEIDGYCAARYKVPFTAVPPFIAALAATIAIYNLYCRKATDKLPEVWSDRYKVAVRTLENISKGVVTLGIDPPPAAAEQASQAGMVAIDSKFSRKNFNGF